MSDFDEYTNSSKRSRYITWTAGPPATPSPPPSPRELIPAYTRASTGRPQKLQRQPTVEKNIQPMKKISSAARQRAEAASPIGRRCLITRVPAASGAKIQLMHVVKRASDLASIRALEHLTGRPRDSLTVDSQYNLFFGLLKLHKAFDAKADSWALCPENKILCRILNRYTELRDKEYDAAALTKLWDEEDLRDGVLHTYTIMPFGAFHQTITRQPVDPNNPTIGPKTFKAPYDDLVVECHLSVAFVVWNLIQKASNQTLSPLCTVAQRQRFKTVKSISVIWIKAMVPFTLQDPVPLLEQPALITGTDNDVRTLRPRKTDEPIGCTKANGRSAKKRKSTRASASSVPKKQRTLDSGKDHTLLTRTRSQKSLKAGSAPVDLPAGLREASYPVVAVTPRTRSSPAHRLFALASIPHLVSIWTSFLWESLLDVKGLFSYHTLDAALGAKSSERQFKPRCKAFELEIEFPFNSNFRLDARCHDPELGYDHHMDPRTFDFGNLFALTRSRLGNPTCLYIGRLRVLSIEQHSKNQLTCGANSDISSNSVDKTKVMEQTPFHPSREHFLASAPSPTPISAQSQSALFDQWRGTLSKQRLRVELRRTFDGDVTGLTGMRCLVLLGQDDEALDMWCSAMAVADWSGGMTTNGVVLARQLSLLLL
ncbi:hypothetical protein BDZ89DRAFT_1040539 [Hymenopellis radicata]|nr:hypothetical protein BDZ89DRAFT_1040539 [Hymenopellis radicata]